MIVLRYALLALPALLCAAPRVSYLIPGDSFKATTKKQDTAILAAICDGTVKDGMCDTCPGASEPGGGFSLGGIVLGHFITAKSTDAFVTVLGCEQMHASVGWGYLVTRESGNWRTVEEVLGLELDHCHAMKFRSGREFLVCEDYRMSSFQIGHTFSAVIGKADRMVFRNLLTAMDTTQACYDLKQVEKANVQKVEFGDLNGDGIEDVSFTVARGTMPDTARRRRLCEQADDPRTKIRRPEPAVKKTYIIRYLFDGQRFKLTEDSKAAAKLFEPVD